MNNTKKTKDQLIAEIQDLRRRLAEAERLQPASDSTTTTGEPDADEHLTTRKDIAQSRPANNSLR